MIKTKKKKPKPKPKPKPQQPIPKLPHGSTGFEPSPTNGIDTLFL